MPKSNSLSDAVEGLSVLLIAAEIRYPHPIAGQLAASSRTPFPSRRGHGWMGKTGRDTGFTAEGSSRSLT